MWQIPKEVPIFVDFITEGSQNRPGHPMHPQGITVHATANTQAGANAKSHAQYVKGSVAAARPASWHFTVDDHEIWQHLPLSENGWHAGDGENGTGNRTTIGVEMCMNRDGNLNRTEANTIWLIAKLLFEVPTINPTVSGTIFQHWDWNKKNCPVTLRERTNGWSNFINAVSQELLRYKSSCYSLDASILVRLKKQELIAKNLQINLDVALKSIRNAGKVFSI